MNNSEMSAGTDADKSGAADNTTSIHSSANTTVVCCLSPDEILNGNKLIADFTGVKIGVDKYSCRMGCYEPLQEKHLNYHKEWGWLMPVVEKIEKLDNCNFSFFIVQTECDIAFSSEYKDNGDDYYAPSFAQKKGDKLISTWCATVEFIKWWNEENAVSKR